MKKLLLLVFFLLLLPKNVNASDVKLNEVMANPSSGQNEWVEIYAPGTTNLDGYYLQDKNDHDNNKTTKTLNSAQHCGDYFVYEYSGDGWLNNTSDESLFLYDNNNNLVDSHENWQAAPEGKTVGRIPNGSGEWKQTKEPTKCNPNIEDTSTPTPGPTSDPGSTATSTPTPTPTPKASPTPTPKVTPKPSATPKSGSPSASPAVLGDQTQSLIASGAGLLDTSTQAQDGFQKGPSKLVAGILVISGTGLILLALGFHFWYRKINKGKILETKDPFQL